MARRTTLPAAAAGLLLAAAAGLLLAADPPPSPSPLPARCAGDRTPPTGAVLEPVNGARVTTSTLRLKASAEDAGSGVAGVLFRADRLGGQERFQAVDRAAPWEVDWPVPPLCGARFAVAVEVRDTCGNLASPASVFVTVDAGCPGR